MLTRPQLADLWQDAAELKREQIFVPKDELCPSYPEESKVLNDQVGLPMVGLVGSWYQGKLVILSVSPSGGRSNYVSIPEMDGMFEEISRLRQVPPGESTLEAFEAQNRAAIKAMGCWRAWGLTGRRIQEILDATGCSPEDIANLTIVPFRTKDDECTRMDANKRGKKYLEAGYQQHLVAQLRALAPQRIVALDKPSRRYAIKFQNEESPQTKVDYYTGQIGANAERMKTRVELREQRVCGAQDDA